MYVLTKFDVLKYAPLFCNFFDLYLRALWNIHSYICRTFNTQSVYNSLEDKLKMTTETKERTGMFGEAFGSQIFLSDISLDFTPHLLRNLPVLTSIVSTSETIRPFRGLTGLKLSTIFFPEGLVSLLSWRNFSNWRAEIPTGVWNTNKVLCQEKHSR